MKFGETEVRMLTDSGASVNIIDKTDYELLSHKLSSLNLEKSRIKLHAYGASKPLTVVGKVQASVESKRQMTVGTFY